MPLQNLSRILDKYESQFGSGGIQQFELLKGLSFYSSWDCGDKSTDFNHLVDLPQKNGQAYPLFDYERELFNTLVSNKHLWVKKATGLGITEFFLRYMAWLCVKDDSLKGAQMCIVTGPRIELAVTLIDRLKRLFTAAEKQPFSLIRFDTKETVI
jgi:hypothetical protein